MLDAHFSGPGKNALEKFKEIDTDHDGKISAVELGAYLEKHGENDCDRGYRDAFVALYMIANPRSSERDISKMTFTEEQTAGFLHFLPSYRSPSLAAKDSFFATQCKEPTAEPEITFDQITHGAKTMTFEDFAAAARDHHKYYSQEQAAKLIEMGHQTPTVKAESALHNNNSKSATTASSDLSGALDFSQFASIYQAHLLPG